MSVNTPLQRAQRFGFLSAEAGMSRHENPYLRFLLESRRSDRANKEAMHGLAAAWWQGWDLAAGSTFRGLHARKSALRALGLHALDNGKGLD